MSTHVYLSPHLDDAVFSCGGLMARQVADGEVVSVVTICAGDPPLGTLSEFAQALHQRWGDTIKSRRIEDRMACGRLGASVHHLDIPDAIYRKGPRDQFIYTSEEQIFGALHPSEDALIYHLVAILPGVIPAGSKVYSPQALGGHVDHRLVRLAVEELKIPVSYYYDLPYAARGGDLPDDIPLTPGRPTAIELSANEIAEWTGAVSAYRSQLSTFWTDDRGILEELTRFHDQAGGVPLIVPESTYNGTS